VWFVASHVAEMLDELDLAPPVQPEVGPPGGRSWGSPRGRGPLGQPGACSCCYGSAVIVVAGRAVAVVVLVVNVRGLRCPVPAIGGPCRAFWFCGMLRAGGGAVALAEAPTPASGRLRPP
jgi:hypothetical protein